MNTMIRPDPEIERLDASAVNSAKVRQPLYAARKKIFPKRASGAYRQFKWIVMAITLGIYYLTPTWRTAASISSSSRSGRRNSTSSPVCW
jgi:hypothetical protein